jgi:hypothetical protein
MLEDVIGDPARQGRRSRPHRVCREQESQPGCEAPIVVVDLVELRVVADDRVIDPRVVGVLPVAHGHYATARWSTHRHVWQRATAETVDGDRP